MIHPLHACSVRRHIHTWPELAFQETNTSAFIQVPDQPLNSCASILIALQIFG